MEVGSFRISDVSIQQSVLSRRFIAEKYSHVISSAARNPSSLLPVACCPLPRPGGMWRSMTAATGRCGRERRTAESRPYGVIPSAARNPSPLLPVACCPLPVARCPLPVACCPLPVACCLLPVARPAYSSTSVKGIVPMRWLLTKTEKL